MGSSVCWRLRVAHARSHHMGEGHDLVGHVCALVCVRRLRSCMHERLLSEANTGFALGSRGQPRNRARGEPRMFRIEVAGSCPTGELLATTWLLCSWLWMKEIPIGMLAQDGPDFVNPRHPGVIVSVRVILAWVDHDSRRRIRTGV